MGGIVAFFGVYGAHWSGLVAGSSVCGGRFHLCGAGGAPHSPRLHNPHPQSQLEKGANVHLFEPFQMTWPLNTEQSQVFRFEALSIFLTFHKLSATAPSQNVSQ